MFAALLGGSHTGDGAFTQNVALELCDSAEDGVEHSACSGSRVDVVG